MQGTSQPQIANLRLDSWTEIAAFFGRDERTVRSWEKERALPVHRNPDRGPSQVYAYTGELSVWLKGTTPPTIDAEVPESWIAAPHPIQTTNPLFKIARNRAVWILAGIVAIIGAVVLAAGFRYVRASTAPGTLAQPVPESISHRPQAEELYLEGRYYWNKRTPEALPMALDYFNQAIVKDPTYARAYVGKADCYNLLREYHALPAKQAFPNAIEAARRAVELDDNSAEAHTALAFLTLFGNWDAPDAERHFQRALALDPNYATAHHWHATYLMTLGRYPEALGEIERAQKLNPSSLAILSDKGFILFLAGQQDTATELLKQLENNDPTFLAPHRYLAEIYLSNKRGGDYLAEEETIAALTHDDSALAIVKAGRKGLAAGGQHGMLMSILQAQKKLLTQGRISAYELARTSALLGQRQETLGYLEKAYQSQDNELMALRNDVAFRSLRSDGSFRDLVTRVGLPALN